MIPAELKELYQEVILDHSRHPRNFRRPERFTHSAEGRNPLCGDQIALYLTLNGEARIADAAFVGQGCAICTASASILTGLLKDRALADAERLLDGFAKLLTASQTPPPPPGLEEAFESLYVLSGVKAFPVRVKCAALPARTVEAALKHQATATTEGASASVQL